MTEICTILVLLKQIKYCSCTTSPSLPPSLPPSTLQLGDLAQSEDALCEANILNNLDPVVWAYLAMVCLKVHAHTSGGPTSPWSASRYTHTLAVGLPHHGLPQGTQPCSDCSCVLRYILFSTAHNETYYVVRNPWYCGG